MMDIEKMGIKDIGTEDGFKLNEIAKELELTPEEKEALESTIDNNKFKEDIKDPNIKDSSKVSFTGGCSAGCAGTCSGSCYSICANTCFSRCLGSYSS